MSDLPTTPVKVRAASEVKGDIKGTKGDIKGTSPVTPPKPPVLSCHAQKEKRLNFEFPDALAMVHQHHIKANLPVLSTPSIPNAARCREFTNGLDSELRSFQRSIDDKDVRAVGVALSGLQHALSGAVLECGMGSLFKRLFDEVQRSNMSKACATSSEAEATCAHYRTDKDTACSFRQVGDKFVVYRDGDEKVLKSVKYSQVDFAPLLGAYAGSTTTIKSAQDGEAPAAATPSTYGVSDCLNDVRAFHELFRAPVLAHPTIPGPKRCELRVNLIAEEVRELKDAIRASDLVEVADALCDIQYVLSGAVLEFGLGSAFKELFARLHDTRMSLLS